MFEFVKESESYSRGYESTIRRCDTLVGLSSHHHAIITFIGSFVIYNLGRQLSLLPFFSSTPTTTLNTAPISKMVLPSHPPDPSNIYTSTGGNNFTAMRNPRPFEIYRQEMEDERHTALRMQNSNKQKLISNLSICGMSLKYRLLLLLPKNTDCYCT